MFLLFRISFQKCIISAFSSKTNESAFDEKVTVHHRGTINSSGNTVRSMIQE